MIIRAQKYNTSTKIPLSTRTLLDFGNTGSDFFLVWLEVTGVCRQTYGYRHAVGVAMPSDQTHIQTSCVRQLGHAYATSSTNAAKYYNKNYMCVFKRDVQTSFYRDTKYLPLCVKG